MSWYDLQTNSTSISYTEWNNMVDRIRQKPVTAQTSASLTLGLNHEIIVCNTTSNAISLTLPEAADSLGKKYLIFFATDGGNDVTVDCAGSDVLNSASNTRGVFADVEDYLILVAVSDDRWFIESETGGAYSTP